MDKTIANKDQFSTILIIAGVSLAILFLLKPSVNQSNFSNLKNKPVNRQVNQQVNRQVNQQANRNIVSQNKPLRENLANINDPSLLLSQTPGNDLPAQQEPASYPPSAVPASVANSAELNKQFPTGTFKPLLLTPSGLVNPASVDSSSADVGSDYTLGVDQNLANPSGRTMQTATDLRPQEMNSGWFNSPYDRDSQLKIENGNLLASATGQAKIGIDTIGQSLKNASYDIRGSVPIVKFDIGPFNNSTIEYDYNVKSLY
jgi:hypothetical protein